MTPEQKEKRKRIMGRSIALGHCVCDPQKPCPCQLFKAENVCECAGEKRPVLSTGDIELTRHVRKAGCASKISRAQLREALAGLQDIRDPRVVVGHSSADDAGVIELDPGTGTILTVDVFCPSVDDPYTFGRIAAANSLSDVYAMGGTPVSALSIIGFPAHELPMSIMSDILRGGIDTMAEAGIDVIGGHSINDEEIKCGFAVVGRAPTDHITTNAGARVGDALVLTKPLGVGIAAFGGQIGRASAETRAAATASMCRLNRVAAEAMVAAGAHAATDVTGYSLLGHLAGIAEASGVAVELEFDAIPLLPGIGRLARQDIIPGGVERNRESIDPALLTLAGLSHAQRSILFCPETSGGLLISLPPVAADKLAAELVTAGHEAAVIGRVTGTRPGGHITATSTCGKDWEPVELDPLSDTPTPPEEPDPEPTAGACCCADADDLALPPMPTQSAADPVVADVGALPEPAAGAEFAAFMEATAGGLDAKTGALVRLALSVASRCDMCIQLQVEGARASGASEEELAGAVASGIAFGGAQANMSYQQLAKRCRP